MPYNFYLDGKFTHSTNRSYPVFAPADSSEIAVVPDADEADVEQAVRAAKRAFTEQWKDFPQERRAKLLLRLADIIERRSEEIGALIGAEGGKFSGDCIKDVLSYAEMVRFYAGAGAKLYGDVLRSGGSGMNYVIKEPLGVVGCLPSWNVPFTGAIQKIAPALAAGNTIVLKAPDEAPLSTLLLGELIDEAGFPPGVVNILCGLGPQTGKIMVDHPDIRLISFTGSIPVGKQIMAAASRTMKRVVLELGGKSPFIVFADADIDRAAEYAARFGIEHQGQLCCAASKVLVERTVKDRFLQAYLRHLQSFKPGYPEDRLTDPMARIGPLFNERQYHRIEEYVRLGRETGKLLIGGKRIVDGKFAKGFYYEPTVFEIVDRRSPVCAEEIFGPVMAVVSFEDEAEALQLANETEFGLSSSVWTRDIGKIQRMTKQIEAGTVWVNTYLHFNNENPWGGMKASGIGREYGVYALESYLEYKNIWIQD